MPVIGGLIIVIGCELLLGRLSDIKLVARTSSLSATAMIVTFLATTQLPLQQAIVIGAVLSLLLYCVQAARQGGLHALVPENGPAGTAWRVAAAPARIEPGTLTVLYYGAPPCSPKPPTSPRVDAKWPDTTDAAEPPSSSPCAVSPTCFVESMVVGAVSSRPGSTTRNWPIIPASSWARPCPWGRASRPRWRSVCRAGTATFRR